MLGLQLTLSSCFRDEWVWQCQILPLFIAKLTTFTLRNTGLIWFLQSGLYFDQRNYSSLRHSKPSSACYTRVCLKFFDFMCFTQINTFLIYSAFWLVKTNLSIAVCTILVWGNWIHIVCVSINLNSGNYWITIFVN